MHLENVQLDDVWPEVAHDLEDRLAREPRFANRPPFLRDIERESLLRMMRRFLENELRRASERPFHPALFEQRFDETHDRLLWLGDRTVSLRGTIDRIDIVDEHPARAVVVDYKSSAAMSLRELAAGNILQAPVYLLAAARVFDFDPIGVEFMGIKQADARGIFHRESDVPTAKGRKLLDAQEWASLLSDCEIRLLAAAADIAAGRIPLAPTTKRCPQSCDYFPLCRGERYELERKVRQPTSEGESEQ